MALYLKARDINSTLFANNYYSQPLCVAIFSYIYPTSCPFSTKNWLYQSEQSGTMLPLWDLSIDEAISWNIQRRDVFSF